MYELYYWPGIQGRGEFVRLALEEVGAPYRDVGREGESGMAKLQSLLERSHDHSSFAPPYLKVGKHLVGQTSNILGFLGEKHNLAPKAVFDRRWAEQIQLTIADMVAETHDTHHPISADLTYEQQKAAALKRARAFRLKRIPKFFDWFESVLRKNKSGFLVGKKLSYVDLSLFQLASGIEYAFPKTYARQIKKYPRLKKLKDTVAARPRIRSYLASERRLEFSEEGIFRHYPELDTQS